MGLNQVPPVVATPEVVSYGTPGTYTFTPPAGTSPSNPAYARVVITAGGGGGAAVFGGRSGAGGSAGQQIILPSVKITGNVSLTVGAGGAGSATAGATASAGGSSTFGSYTATGGAGAIAGSPGAATTLMPASSQGGSGVDGMRMAIYGNFQTNCTRYTADGVNWTTANSPGNNAPTASWFNNGRFHAHHFSSSGQYYFKWSTDAINWNQVSPSFAGMQVIQVASSGNTMFAVGSFPNGGGSTNQYMFSTNNGDSWTSGNFPISNTWGVAITNGAGTWVTAQQSTGANNVRSNTTLGGASAGWVARSAGSASNTWYGGAFGNNRFVITAYEGLIFSSPDGATWTQRASGQGVLERCTFLGGRFFTRDANSNSVNYLTSTDGETWTTGTLPSGSASTGAWSFGYIVNTYYCITNNGRVHSSTDGVNWIFLTTLDSQIVTNGITSGSNPASTGSLGTVTAATPAAPTLYGSDLSPTGGGGGNPTSTTGAGGSGGTYIGVSAAASTGSAAATVGQVPGAGGGGGGTGSTAGVAGANGLVAIYL